MRVAVVGYGVEGKASLEYWSRQGHEVTVLDQNAMAVPEDVKLVSGPNYLEDLSEFDLVVRSPGVHPRLLKEARLLTSPTAEFLANCPATVIGVTGTKGKGTTATLISRMLEKGGHKVHLGGNIGTPMLSLLPDIKPDDLVVLELSSFQLMDLRRSPQIAVSLMMALDHLDWHKDMQEYVEAKSQIFRHQKPQDLAVYHAENEYSRSMADLSPARKRPFMSRDGSYVADGWLYFKQERVMPVEEIGLIGQHNWQNVCAAVAACWDLADINAIKEAVREFKGLEHRLQLVAEAGGVRYYDDSFSTNPEPAIAAIRAFKEPKIMILGGSEKGADFGDLAAVIAGANVKAAILIGDTATKIEKALLAAGYKGQLVTGLTKMPDIVQKAAEIAESGDVVLLSPACASFGLFKDYKDRGEQFGTASRALVQSS